MAPCAVLSLPSACDLFSAQGRFRRSFLQARLTHPFHTTIFAKIKKLISMLSG
jgi:hypothetical protein